jgi:hypothetical protein
MDGYLKKNNDVTDEIVLPEERDDGTTYLILLGIVLLSIFAFVAVIILRRKD